MTLRYEVTKRELFMDDEVGVNFGSNYWDILGSVTLQRFQKVGEIFEEGYEMEIREHRASKLRFFRLPVTTTVLKPLRRAVILEFPFYGEVRAMIQYEHLPNFCFNCGRVDHTVCNCDQISGEMTPVQRRNFKYEAWLMGPSEMGELVQEVPVTVPVECGKERDRHGKEGDTGNMANRGGGELVIYEPPTCGDV